jgi:hypothetical protein
MGFKHETVHILACQRPVPPCDRRSQRAGVSILHVPQIQLFEVRVADIPALERGHELTSFHDPDSRAGLFCVKEIMRCHENSGAVVPDSSPRTLSGVYAMMTAQRAMPTTTPEISLPQDRLSILHSSSHLRLCMVYIFTRAVGSHRFQGALNAPARIFAGTHATPTEHPTL